MVAYSVNGSYGQVGTALLDYEPTRDLFEPFKPGTPDYVRMMDLYEKEGLEAACDACTD